MGNRPRKAEVIATDAPAGTEPLSWEDAQARFNHERFYWLATVHHLGRPQIRPVLAVWLDDFVYTTSSPGAQKARNLEHAGYCSLAALTDDMEIVLEGTASRLTDVERLEDVAATYLAKYGWPATVKDAAFDAPYGAPTAGPPPYVVYEVRPETMYGFGSKEPFDGQSTRWSF